MQVVNDTPFAVDLLPWVHPDGDGRLTIIVKMTCDIRAGQVATVADEQLPILQEDVPQEPECADALRFECDLAPFKPRTDIVLIGHARAPRGVPVRELEVGLRVGRLHRRLRVIGDRHWCCAHRGASPTISEPKPFTSMPLTYDRSFGGLDVPGCARCAENPIGAGLVGKASPDCADRKRLPNIEDPQALVRSWRDRPRPAGFAFYARNWQPRLKLAGTYDERHWRERAPKLPVDYSLAFHQAAHPDLIYDGYLAGNERIELENMSRAPMLSVQLPGLRPDIRLDRRRVSLDQWQEAEHARTGEFPDASSAPTREESSPAQLDTLVLLPDDRRLYLVYRAVFPLPGLDPTMVAGIKVALPARADLNEARAPGRTGVAQTGSPLGIRL